jgi:hypothetical protein
VKSREIPSNRDKRRRLNVHRRPEPLIGSHILVGAFLGAFCEVLAARPPTRSHSPIIFLSNRSKDSGNWPLDGADPMTSNAGAVTRVHDSVARVATAEEKIASAWDRGTTHSRVVAPRARSSALVRRWM